MPTTPGIAAYPLKSRRWALMGILRLDHFDPEEFLALKRSSQAGPSKNGLREASSGCELRTAYLIHGLNGQG